MSALRKPDYLTGGYKIAFLKLMARLLTGDQHLLLFLLVDHVSLAGCFPSLDTLAEEANWSIAKVRRVRDQLAEMGIIGFISGTGHKSSRYSIPGLAEHTAELKGKKASRVPNPGAGGATQGGTEPLNPSLNKKKDGPDLRIVPTTGWQALVFHASEKMQRHWLPHVELVSEGPDGIRLKTAGSLYADRIRRELEGDGELHALARSLDINPERVTIESPGHSTAPARPATMPLTPQGGEEMAQRIEDAKDKPDPVIAGGNTVSLQAYRTRKEDVAREHDDGIPVGAAEMARPRRDDERAERLCDGDGDRDGAGSADAEAPRDSDGD